MSKTKSINGHLLRKILIYGYENLSGSISYLNEINVFPVSDGDTGNNMKITYETGIGELIVSSSFTGVFAAFMQGMLMGSRGNSGSILSQYFWGIFEHTRGKDEISVAEFCSSLKNAYATAYQAVLQPVEGTMLTVMRESIENTAPKVNPDTSLEQFLEELTGEMFICVKNTTGRLEILRSNNVVDSGAAGFYLIFEGMKNGLYNNGVSDDLSTLFDSRNGNNAQNPLTFRYCTEFLLKLNAHQPKEYFSGLLKPQGDSLLVTINNDMLKVHIHTNDPQSILDDFSQFGVYAEKKIDDMLVQQELSRYSPQRGKHSDYILISFVQGDGIIELFDQLGCDIVFTATQNYHISKDSFNLFIDKFIDKQIIVLPNDEKIYSTALKLYPPSEYPNVHIIDSQNVIKSYFLLSLMIGTDDVDGVLRTFARHEKAEYFIAKILAINIRQEMHFIGITETGTVINRNLSELLKTITASGIAGKFTTVVVFHGQAARKTDVVAVSSFFEEYDDLDFAMIDGKQDDFDFIIGAM